MTRRANPSPNAGDAFATVHPKCRVRWADGTQFGGLVSDNNVHSRKTVVPSSDVRALELSPAEFALGETGIGGTVSVP